MDRKTDSNHSFGYTRQRVLYTPALATGQAEWRLFLHAVKAMAVKFSAVCLTLRCSYKSIEGGIVL